MDKNKAIELLKQYVTEIPKLRKLHYNNQEFKLWQARVGTIIKEGLAADDYERLCSVQEKYFPEEFAISDLSLVEDYLPKLNDYETLLKSIIEKYQILGIEGEGDNGGEVEKMAKGGKKMNEAENQKIIGELRDLYKKLKSYNRYLRSENLSEARRRYMESLREGLVRKSSALKETIYGLTGKLYFTQFGQTHEIWADGLNPSGYLPIKLTGLGFCIDASNEAIGKLELTPPAELGLQEVKVIEPPKAFIAHEGETRALSILKEFLEALGIQYFIAESKASNGRSIEGQVDWSQSKADFTICLATKGKAINKKTGKHFMAPNIADELGRARQIFKNRIILLEQKGLESHTNIKEIVYENFTTTNMEKALIKIAKEMRNWGFLKVGK